MSKYQPRIFINNPEKNVPTNLIEQFFLILKSANLDEIKNFVIQNKLKYNIIDKSDKGSSKKTPYHVILELDNKIANNETKLEIIKFLGNMGAPIDLPDITNVWPIHLAVISQSEDIVNFFIKKGVSLNVKDGSNNTPLHYAVMGSEINCPKQISVGKLIPTPSFDKLTTNKILEQTNTYIANLFNSPNLPEVTNNIIVMINTIMRIPEMYTNFPYSKNLQSNVIKIFTDITLNPNYNINLNKQQNELEQLIDTTYSEINDQLLRGLISPLNIIANNEGWGPTILLPNGTIKPYDKINNILPETVDKLYQNITNEYNMIKKNISNISDSEISKLMLSFIPTMIEYINSQYLNKLIFCSMNSNGKTNDCTNINYGEEATLLKIFVLLTCNYCKINYSDIFTVKIMNNFQLLNNQHYSVIIGYSNGPFQTFGMVLWNQTLTSIISSLQNNNIDSAFDNNLNNIINNIDQVCIRNKLFYMYYNNGYGTDVINTILNDPIGNILKLPLYTQFQNDYNKLRPMYKNGQLSFLTMLNTLLYEIQPTNQFFRVFALPNQTFMLDIFRLLQYIYDYKSTGTYHVGSFPIILGYPINDWFDKSIVSTLISPLTNIEHPELLFLSNIFYKFIQNYIYNIIKECIDDIIQKNPNDNYFKPLDDSYMYYSLIPATIETTTFFSDNINPIVMQYKNNIWDYNNELIIWFDNFILTTDINIEDMSILVGNNINLFDNTNLFNLLNNFIIPFITNTYDELITYIKSAFNIGIQNYFSLRNSIKEVNKISLLILYNYDTIDNVINNIITNFNNILPIFIYVDIYGLFFIFINQQIASLENFLNKTFDIVKDITNFIEKKTYYYIPQIFLPAFITSLFSNINILININTYISNLNNLVTSRLPDVDNIYTRNIKLLGIQYFEFINIQIKEIYDRILNILRYHNDVINFLNYNSAYNLISTHNDLFTMNLIPIDDFPDLLNNLNTTSLEKILNDYSIPSITYYARTNENNDVDINIFNINQNSYRDVIPYERIGEISNMPNNGDNSQLNIDLITSSFKEKDTAIEGQWIMPINRENPLSDICYDNAFIGIINKNYDYDELMGLSPSIKSIVAKYLKILKYRVIQDIIQYIANNRYKPINDPTSTTNIFDSIINLANNDPYNKINDVKVYIVIGKLVDETLNKLLEYVIRQSINNWIYSYTSTSSLKNIVDVVNKTIANIKDKNYLKFSLHEINNSIINNLLETSPRFLEFRLSQLEPDPNNIPNTKISDKFVHYLFNINYFSSTSTYYKCYQINPNIVKKLITSENLNFKNSDGNTPLHLAVSLYNPTIVKILSSYNNTKTFTNNNKKTPLIMALDNSLEHINFLQGQNILNYYNNFVNSFNNILISRIMNEKFGNNVLKNITYGVPIILSMYDHMFNIYLRNYRYNYTNDLKTRIDKLSNKYFKTIPDIYPTDIFEINDQNNLIDIFIKQDPINNAAINVDEMNKKKVDKLNKQMEIIVNQINELIKEKNKTSNDNIGFINDLMNKLEESKNKLNDEINNINGIKKINFDSSIIFVYESILNFIINNSKDRLYDLVDFYNESFEKVSYNKEIHLEIWKNYLNKPIINCPSIIFYLINQIFSDIIFSIRSNIITSDVILELNTILEFMKLFKNYIDLKELLPINLDENPIIENEFKQIIYLINLIITPTIKNIILSSIYQQLKEMDTIDLILIDQQTIFDEILNIEFNGQTIDSYLTNVLPLHALKTFTMIYSNNMDNTRSITNSSDLFIPILNIIKANTIIQITENSTLIRNFREYIIPFLINIYQNFILVTRSTIYGYEKYLLNTYQLIEIVNTLIN